MEPEVVKDAEFVGMIGAVIVCLSESRGNLLLSCQADVSRNHEPCYDAPDSNDIICTHGAAKIPLQKLPLLEDN